MDLKEIYESAAKQAFTDGVSDDDENALVEWINRNCRYSKEHEFFLVLGIGCELAKIHSRERGFDDNIHEAFMKAVSRAENAENMA